MKWFQRAIAGISSAVHGVTKLALRHDALGTRWPAWGMRPAPNRQALAARYPLAIRANYLISDTPIGEAIAEKLTSNIVGDGPAVRSRHPNQTIAAALVDAFNDLYPHIGIDGQDLAGVLQTCVRTLVASGEFFLRTVTVEAGELRVQIIPPEQVDPTINRELDGGGRIIAGIEFDWLGRIVAYWVLPSPPDLAFSLIGPAVRVPANDIIHIFERRVAGQVRGTSWLAPVATRLIELSKLEDALLARMNVAALFSAFIIGDGVGGFDDATKDSNALSLSLEPGVVRDLRGLGNASVTFSDVPGVEGAPELLTHMLRSIAAGTSLPSPILSSNFSDTNYSSGTMAFGQFARRIRFLQSSLLGTQCLDRIWQRFVSLEMLTGRLQASDFYSDPAPYFATSWMWPSWPSLNPYDETRADQIAIQAGIRSRQEIVASRGRDVSEVDAEISNDNFTPRLN